MKTLKQIVRTLLRPAALALLGLAALAGTSQAARIDFQVYAKGKWALIVPNHSAGGNVVWDQSRSCYVTAWAARGESICVFYSATFAGEYTCDSGGYYESGGSRSYGAIPLPYVYSSTVSTDPNKDFLHYWIWTNCDYKDKRVPIAKRQ